MNNQNHNLMYYSYQKKLYTREQLAGQTFSEDSKPEPLFTLDEMRDIYNTGFSMGWENKSGWFEVWMKRTFDINI